MAATCKLMSGFEILDLTAGGYAFRVPSPGSWDTVSNVQKRAYGAGGVEISDKTLTPLTLYVEGHIIADTAAAHLALWKGLTNFLRNKTSLRLFFDDNAYYKVDQAVAFDPIFPPGSGHRGNQIKIKLSITDPYIYTYEPAYLLRFGNPYLWTEGRGNIYPATGFVITHRRDGIGGMDDYSVAVEQSTTNLFSANQASVETNLTGFTAVNAGGLARTVVPSLAWDGSAFLECLTPGVVPNEGYYIGISPGPFSGDYTGSIYIRASSATYVGKIIRLYIYDVTNAISSVVQEITLTLAYRRAHITINLGAGSAELRLYVVTKLQEVVHWYSDAHQIENRVYPTSFVIGSRAIGTLAYDCMAGVESSQKITFFTQCSPSCEWNLIPPLGKEGTLISWGWGSSGFALDYTSGTNLLSIRIKNVAAGFTLISWNYSGKTGFTPISVGMTIDFTAGLANLYIDGALVASGSGSWIFPAAGNNLLFHNPAISAPPNGLLDNVSLLDRIATATEIAAWHNDFSGSFPRRGFLAHFHDAVNEETVAGAFTVNNPENFDTPATIRLAAQETVPSVTMVNTSDPRTFTYAEPAFVNGQTTVIDGVGGGTALRGSTNVINYMQGVFLRLVGANNALTFQGHDTEVSVLFEARWI